MNPKQSGPFKNHGREPYSLHLPAVVLMGGLLSATFFALLTAGPLNYELLKRYCLSHWVAVASVCLFFTGISGLFLKWLAVQSQLRIIGRATATLKRVLADGPTIKPAERVDWLLASWQAEPAAIQSSWLGRRLLQILHLQQSRGRRGQIEQDLKSLSEQTADEQYESYSLLRIIHWAMPMLGFLGTVLGISQTLGQLDTQKLATQQQEAMTQLTAGLYVAFDTTAIALVLTVTSMFVQFAINRIELSMMARVNKEIHDALIPFLATDPLAAHDNLLAPVREMASDLVTCVRDLVRDQAQLWSQSIAESQRQWVCWTDKLASEVDSQLVSALQVALTSHLAGLEAVQENSGRQFELRLQQWQTTLSEQTRTLHQQQKEMVQQTTTLQQLVQSTADLKKVEQAISDNFRAIEQSGHLQKATGRIESATQCVAEAVAMLATSLERAGLVRVPPQRPRPASRGTTVNTATDLAGSDSNNSETATIPISAARKQSQDADISSQAGNQTSLPPARRGKTA